MQDEQPNDSFKINLYSGDLNTGIESNFMFNPDPLAEPSPSLPDKFPLELLPKDYCENELLTLVECMIDNKFDNIPCDAKQLNFYKCKRKRDSTIFSSIKDWECKEFKTFPNDKKTSYLKDLVDRKIKKQEDYEKAEYESNNIGYRKRLDSDIMQLNWRINYIPNCLL